MSHDVLIVGGGPSGSTAAQLLAASGARVLVLEREVFPRFRIGESLLPAELPLFERLGLDPADHGGVHQRKSGAEFFDEARGRHAVYRFADSLDHTHDHAWQVDRGAFDLALLEAAERAGAEVRQGVRVTDVALEADRVEAHTPEGAHAARYLLDATGQDSLLAHLHRTRHRIEAFGLGAIFRHYGSLRPAIAEELAAEGYIKIFFVEDGWLWAIPLGGGRLSVGLVTRRKGLRDAWLDEEIAASPELSRLLDGAEAEGSHRRLGSFSFHNGRPHGPRWACIGDAACFLDPIFSSGVTFAMLGAEDAADVLAPALAEGREADPALMEAHAAKMTEGYNVFATLIHSVYQRRLLPDLLFTASQDPDLRRGLTSVLAGDVWHPGNPFQEKLMRSLRRRFDVRLASGANA